MFGVDEAGRGPVLGSMFIGCVSVPDDTALPEGMADSKQLSASRIESLADELHHADDVTVATVEVPPDRIDDPETDMTMLTAQAFADAIDRSASPGESGYLDAGHPDTDVFEESVTKRAETSVTVQAEHGADDTHPVVSAASIIAKAAREDHVARLAEEYGDIGSGYPSDPTTREFLAEYLDTHGRFPEPTRTSWGTCEDLRQASD